MTRLRRKWVLATNTPDLRLSPSLSQVDCRYYLDRNFTYVTGNFFITTWSPQLKWRLQMLDYPRQKSRSTVGDFKVMWRTALKSERFLQERRWICQLRRHVRIRSHE